MKNFKNLLLLTVFGLFTAQAPVLKASEEKPTNNAVTKNSYASFIPKFLCRSSLHFDKLIVPTILSCEAIALGAIILYDKLKKPQHRPIENAFLGISATLAACTIAAKIATSTCNPIIDALHKNKTDALREKTVQDKERIKEEFRKNEGVPCFIENPDGTTSNCKFQKINNQYIIFSLPTEAQKSRILDILQTKELPETFFQNIRIVDTENASHLIKNLKTIYQSSENPEEIISLESFLKTYNIEIGTPFETNGFYLTNTNSVYYINSKCLTKDITETNLADIIDHLRQAMQFQQNSSKVLCFLKNSDNSISYYNFFKSKNMGYFIFSDLTQNQKNKILRILQAKGLPESLIEKIRIMHTQNAIDLIKNLKTRTRSSQNPEEFISLESCYKSQNIEIGSPANTRGAYIQSFDEIYINSKYFINNDFDADLIHTLLHEVTHHDYYAGRKYYVDALWPFTKYILPAIEMQQANYGEEYRAELKALKLMNCTKCIKLISAGLEYQAVFEGYVASDKEFIRQFLAQHPDMPETCALCQDHLEQKLK